MAERERTSGTGLAPPADPRADYERDFYSWLMEQARFISEGRWSAVDRDNIAEEIESLGREQFAKLESALRVLLLHLLKWDHQPDSRSRNWSSVKKLTLAPVRWRRLAIERSGSGATES